MNVPEGFAFLGQGYIGIIPVQVYIMVLIAFVVWFLVNRTKFGRYVLAMGGNPEAARVSGIDIVWVRFGTYVCSGCAAALAAMILTARAASAQPAAGTGMEMDAIAAVVIGGTNMKGGKVNVVGALFGCLIVGMVNNGLNLLRIDSAWQIVAKGCLILFAVVLDRISTMSMVRNAERRELKKVGVK
jgi:ribose/xylose/arabinose/galactoside ABC-type transport system permease subunit